MKYIYQISLILLVFISLSSSVAAQDRTGTVGGEDPTGTVPRGETVSLNNPIAANDINDLFMLIIDIVIIFAVPVIVFFIIYAGFMYVTARGNENTISKAHMALLYALIGGVLILGARVLITVVQGTVDEVASPSSSRSR